MPSAFDPRRRRAGSPSSTSIQFVSFAMVFLTVMAAGAVAYFTELEIVKGRDWVIHTYRVRSNLSNFESEIMRVRDRQENSVLRREEGLLPRSREQAQRAMSTAGELRRLTKDNPAESNAWPS
jgi:CHASE3 domain sensor protein